jgi:purine nucleosidase/pyrimidine-specific ribonucleoside hydrolase
VPGNVTPVAEFNVSVDPESAGVVLGAGLPLTLVPLDATRKVVWRAPGDPSGLESGDPAARFAGALGRAALDHAGRLGEPGVFMHDPLAVGVALDPTLVEVETLPVTVETQGVITRGMTVADRRSGRHHDPAWPRVRVALGVDAIRFLRMFEERVCPRSA